MTGMSIGRSSGVRWPRIGRARASLAATAALLVMGAGAAVADVRLIVFEQAGCPYCEAFRDEIAPAYPKTAEARVARLEYRDLVQGVPTEWALQGTPYVTPTFVLLDDEREVGRIEGYPGDEFFWFRLDRLLMSLPEQKRAGFSG